MALLATMKELRAEITPLVRFELAAPAVRFTAACFGGEDTKWSLLPLQEPQDVHAHQWLCHKIRSAMKRLDAERIYAPSPRDFNGRIIDPGELSQRLVLGKGVIMLRNKDCPADGTFLRASGHAGVFSAGGCSVIVAALDDIMIFAHAGRECVINRKRVLGHSGARPYESVVDSIVQAFLGLGYKQDDLSRLHAWVLFSIRPEDFFHRYDDPEHGEYNYKVAAHLDALRLSWGYTRTSEGIELDIPRIASQQFVRLGARLENIHLEQAYLPRELPHTRSGDRLARYLVAIVRQ